MSSPPPVAGSPTYPPSLPLPRKRPSLAPQFPSSSKRRKPSEASNSSHPLRQTSFPPPEGSDPVVDPFRGSSFSPSEVSFSGSKFSSTKKRRGRKGARSVPKLDNGDVSMNRSGVNGSAKDGEGLSRVGRELEDEPEDDEGDADGDLMYDGGEKMDEAAKKQEREHMAMLLNAFSQEQSERYDTWRRVRLKKETVRRITNQTLSQSVPASIVTTINGYTKVFIGELIERARDVQTEWLAASPTYFSGEAKEDGGELTVEERDRGPLRPDHLREALRRYKRDREGGSTGFHGLSLHGEESTASRVGGKRLFR